MLRQTEGRKEEEVALITSAPLGVLDAALWLRLNRQGWGIESGLHQRLDVSYNDDRCRVQSDFRRSWLKTTAPPHSVWSGTNARR